MHYYWLMGWLPILIFQLVTYLLVTHFAEAKYNWRWMALANQIYLIPLITCSIIFRDNLLLPFLVESMAVIIILLFVSNVKWNEVSKYAGRR